MAIVKAGHEQDAYDRLGPDDRRILVGCGSTFPLALQLLPAEVQKDIEETLTSCRDREVQRPCHLGRPGFAPVHAWRQLQVVRVRRRLGLHRYRAIPRGTG